MRIGLLAILALTLMIPANMIYAQGAMLLDHVDGLLGTDTISTDEPITFHIRFENSTGANIIGSSNGFRVYSPDGAVWDPITWAPYFDMDTYQWVFPYPDWQNIYNGSIKLNDFSVTGSGADTIGFAGYSDPSSPPYSPGVPPDFNEIVYTVTTLVDDNQHGKTLCLDSSFYPPENQWLWASDTGVPGVSLGEVFPLWDGPHCYFIRDPDYIQPSNLIISTDSLHFEAIESESSPNYQSFEINTDFEQLSFMLSEGASWLQVNPTSGNTPQSINVFVSTSGLSIGTYYETIVIESPTAANSPQSVVVKVEIIPPPPEIAVSETDFTFLAIADGDNPDPKTLTISNVGGSTLNWTVSNNEPWLSLDPLFGTDEGDVTLSVDITGMTFGDYDDTVVVSDPSAVNDPVKVAVRLTIGSNLPVIEVDSAFNYVIVPSGSYMLYRDITIRNGGIGEMNFWLEENASRFYQMTPSSGTAPQTVTVDLKVQDDPTGEDVFDTIWVYSNEAVNSPFPVVFLFHYVDVPAELYVDIDSVEFSVYQCDQGAGVPSSTDSFHVQNIGADNPVLLNLLFESELFTIKPTYGSTPSGFMIKANDTQVPLGTYYDTILVSAVNAINSPQRIIVKTNVIEPDFPPWIVPDSSRMTFNIKEGTPSPAFFRFAILNASGGCMEWELTEEIPWLSFDSTSGNVPGLTYITPDFNGFTFGTYQDTFTVTAPSATNNPKKVPVELNVWLFRGDCNFNGKVNISDVTYLVYYLFATGDPPKPEKKVCDVDCDGKVNISDVTYIVAYLFSGSVIPCDDP